MRTKLTLLLYMSVCVSSLLTAGCERQPVRHSGSGSESSQPAALTGKVLAPFQYDLLDVAFRTASAIPLQPHVKDRCRTQEAVVDVCLELDQPLRASEYASKIVDWRCGAANADLALYYAQHGRTDLSPQYFIRAEEIAKTAEDWRRDRIRVKIAQAYVCMGQTEKARQFEANVESSESGKVARVRAMQADDAAFDVEMKALDACIASKNFDMVRNSLESSTQLYDRFYGNPERRNLVENKIKESWKPMPLPVRIDLLMELSRVAVRHGDKAKATELANETQGIMDGANWPVTFRIGLMSRLAAARFQAGDAARARADADAALSLFDTARDKIVDVERAQTILPLAETYKAIGDTTAALSVYKRAIDNSVINPNSRPRAEDLSAICRSMALHAVEPDASVWNSIRKSSGELGNPW